MGSSHSSVRKLPPSTVADREQPLTFLLIEAGFSSKHQDAQAQQKG